MRSNNCFEHNNYKNNNKKCATIETNIVPLWLASYSWTALKILSSVLSSQFGGKWSIRAALSCLFISPPRRLLSHFLSTNQQLCYHTQSLDHSHGRLVDQGYALCWTWITVNNVFLCNMLIYARLPSSQKEVSHLYTKV